MRFILIRSITAPAILVAVLSSCAGIVRDSQPTQKSNLTMGVAKSQIIKGKTTQAEILQLFGAPNLVTKNRANDEVWNYNRMSVDSASGSDAAFAIFWSGSRALSSTTTKSFDLILVFDDKGIVKDYSIVAASF
ncbi:MAG: hypothetical protein ACE5MM_09980 [Nitrospiraceae bacterium]